MCENCDPFYCREFCNKKSKFVKKLLSDLKTLEDNTKCKKEAKNDENI